MLFNGNVNVYYIKITFIQAFFPISLNELELIVTEKDLKQTAPHANLCVRCEYIINFCNSALVSVKTQEICSCNCFRSSAAFSSKLAINKVISSCTTNSPTKVLRPTFVISFRCSEAATPCYYCAPDADIGGDNEL